METNPLIDTDPPAIVVEKELGKFVTNVDIPAPHSVKQGFVINVEIVLGIFTFM